MRTLIDLNVVLDVLQRREPHYGASAGALSLVLRQEPAPVIPVHHVTTLYYLLDRHAGHAAAMSVIDWMLAKFDISMCDKKALQEARAMEFGDFEDAVTSELAKQSGCEVILTRNVADFSRSPVPALTPAEFLARQPARP